MGEDGQWRISPAYDMGYAYNPQGGWTSMHQMSVNGKFDAISRADLLACATANDIKEASYIIDQVCDAASNWPRIAKDCGVPLAMTEDIVKNMQFL